jgi:hypothetical protein
MMWTLQPRPSSSEVDMVKRGLRFLGVLVASILIATIMVVLIENMGFDVVALAE